MDKFWFLTLGLLVGWVAHWLFNMLFCKCKCTNENCNKHGLCHSEKGTNCKTTDAYTSSNVSSDTSSAVSTNAMPFAGTTPAATIVPSGLFQVNGKDDLKVIEGIGPKIGELLNSAGIQHFHELAVTPVATLEKLLKEAGTGFQMANPSTWPEQASLIAKGDKAAFERLTEELKGGVRVS